MTAVHKVVFTPEAGDIVELPTEVGRIDVDCVGSPELGYGTLTIGVVGSGDLEEYVVLKTHADSAEIEGGAQVLGVDVARDVLWYAVPISAYGGQV